MEEGLLPSELRSFRMDRRSPEAVRLREAVSKKLLEFMGDYSDEVLAEYIVVLVCNGKNQNQARDDLEAFLGDDSGAFVSWLWDHLFKEFLILKVISDNSNPEAGRTYNHGDSLNRVIRSDVPADLPSHSVRQPKNGTTERSLHPTNANLLKPTEGSERLQPSHPNSIEPSADVSMDRLQGQTYSKGAVQNKTSCLPMNSEVPSPLGGMQSLQHDFQQKIPESNASTMASQNTPETKMERGTVNLRSVIAAEEHQLSTKYFAEPRLSSAAISDTLHQTRPRGNVWDRLGKPCKEDVIRIKEKYYQHVDFVKTGTQSEEPQNSRLKRTSSVIQSSSDLNKRLTAVNRGDTEGTSLNPAVENKSSNTLENADSLKRRRQFGDFSTDSSKSFCKEILLQDKEQSPKLHGSLPIKHTCQQTVEVGKSVASYAKFGSTKPSWMRSGSDVSAVSESQANNTSLKVASVKKLLPIRTTFPTTNPNSRTEVVNASQKPAQDEVLAVKLKLRQIEMDMLKLRTKQVALNLDGKQNQFSALQNQSDEDMESRTVLVTNVHFAATKEAIISHFTSCGTVHKVIMLTDAVTAQPKGAAYIVFANKESVAKAISLSGTSFFSRVLKIIRKAEVPPNFLVPNQPALNLKQPQTLHRQPHVKDPSQKHYSTTHLQWKRDQQKSR
ncbi:Nuclear cap-binding protein subunit 2 [Apostasia shenzhenica]|uniref:Nuclear cap-binding protein subunit 2 n=1 Tax=Apostasia shenzhenica TaxID=1088818 RepID=A0A2I0A7B0_9ASPA|nr:Nuclear cap-binding protein subunit 2 [Apostasia shenzhenica]